MVADVLELDLFLELLQLALLLLLDALPCRFLHLDLRLLVVRAQLRLLERALQGVTRRTVVQVVAIQRVVIIFISHVVIYTVVQVSIVIVFILTIKVFDFRGKFENLFGDN